MKSEIVGHIDFYDQTEVAVMTESTESGEDQLVLELAMLSWFTLRIFALAREPYRGALRKLFYQLVYSKKPDLILDGYELNLVKPSATKGKKGFKLYIQLLDTGFLTKNKPYGFGLLGKGTDYYAPMSAVALACYLLKKHKNKPAFTDEIYAALEHITDFAHKGAISVRNEQDMTMEIVRHYASKAQ